MKNTIFLSLSLLLTFSITNPVSAQDKEISKEEIERRILEESKSIEVVNLSEDSPILKGLLEKDKEICLPAEGPLNTEVYKTNDNAISMTKHLVKDTGAILIAPLGWKKEEWLKVSAIVAGLTLLSTQDDEIQKFSQSIRSEATDKISYPLEKLGNGGPALALLGATYATSLAIKDPKLQNTTLSAIEATAIAAVLTTIGKRTFHRQRPNSTTDQYKFSGPNLLSSKNLSFPSGHTGTAFAIATVFAEAYGDSKIAPILAYSAATLAGLSRINDNKHWASDVAGGAVLGYLAGKFVASRRLNRDPGSSKVKVVPAMGLNGTSAVGVTVTIPLNRKSSK